MTQPANTELPKQGLPVFNGAIHGRAVAFRLMGMDYVLVGLDQKSIDALYARIFDGLEPIAEKCRQVKITKDTQ